MFYCSKELDRSILFWRKDKKWIVFVSKATHQTLKFSVADKSITIFVHHCRNLLHLLTIYDNPNPIRFCGSDLFRAHIRENKLDLLHGNGPTLILAEHPEGLLEPVLLRPHSLCQHAGEHRGKGWPGDLSWSVPDLIALHHHFLLTWVQATENKRLFTRFLPYLG